MERNQERKISGKGKTMEGTGKRSKIKRAAALFLLLLLAGLATACGETEYVVEYGVDGYVYLSRKLQSMENVKDFNIVGDYLYYMQDAGNKTAVKRISVASMTAGGGELDFSGNETVAEYKQIEFELPEGADESGEGIDFLSYLDNGKSGTRNVDMGKKYGRLSLTGYAVGAEGDVYCYLQASVGEYFSMDYVGGVLCRQNPEGGQASRVYMPEMLDVAVDVQGRVFVLTGEGILVLDRDGNQMMTISTDAYQTETEPYKEELFTDSEGRIYYTVVDGSQYTRTTCEIVGEGTPRLENTGEFLGTGITDYSAASDGNIFQFSSDSEGVLYEYDRKEKSRKKLLKWHESGILGAEVLSVAEITPEILLVSCRGSFGMQGGIYQLTRRSVEELPQKEMLVVASPNVSMELQKAVMRFNAQSDTYRVVVDSYGAEFDDTTGWQSLSLDASLVSDNPPDLLDVGAFNMVKYAKKGVLEDLTSFLEDSNVIDMGDIPDNMLKGVAFDGKLVSVPVSFRISAVIARTSQVEDLEGWTMEDLYKLTDRHPESVGAMMDDGHGYRRERGWLLEVFCARHYTEEFVDWDRWECSFDSEGFRKLLEWVKTYGCEPVNVGVPAGGYIILEDVYIPEEVLLAWNWSLAFPDLSKYEIQFGEEVCLKGYPSSDGEGRLYGELNSGLGIVSGSAHKDAAWEFFELYWKICREQSWGVVASKKDIEEWYGKAITPEYRGSASNEGEESEMRIMGSFYIGPDTIDYYVIPQEYAGAVLNAIETADFSPMSEEERAIVRIVVDEAENYFKGDKNVEEVADIIQNRVSLLLNERKP